MWDVDPLFCQIGQLSLDSWSDIVSFDTLEELLALLITDCRILGDDDGWNEAF